MSVRPAWRCEHWMCYVGLEQGALRAAAMADAALVGLLAAALEA